MSEPNTLTSTYDIQLSDKTVCLRLTVAAQLRLQKKFKKDTIDIIMESTGDPEKMLAVFDEALNFKDNPNEGMTGEALYDALVDNGTKGIDAFAEILFNIANASGILSDKQREQVNTGISKTFDAIFDGIENGRDTQQPVEDTEEEKTVSFPK